MTILNQDLTNPEAPFNVEFSLTVTVRGKKLEDIDNGLIEAVGARLQARLKTPLKMPDIKLGEGVIASMRSSEGQVQNIAKSANQVANLAPQAPVATPAPAAEAPKKRGRPPGAKKSVEAAAPVGAGAAEEAIEAFPDEVVPPPAMAAIATLDDTVQALKLVNSTFNVDKARECLAHFNVARCSDLTAEQRVPFVNHCRTLCGAGA